MFALFTHNLALLLACSTRRPGDSGQGESDSEHDSSDDTDNELASHELIKWKKGRLIGKGAFGKVVMSGVDHMMMLVLCYRYGRG